MHDYNLIVLICYDKDRLFDEFNSLSVIYQKPAEQFVNVPIEVDEEEEEEEEEDEDNDRPHRDSKVRQESHQESQLLVCYQFLYVSNLNMLDRVVKSTKAKTCQVYQALYLTKAPT
jgi:hypothetical protein